MNRIFLNNEVKNLKFENENTLLKQTLKKIFNDIVINATYEGSNEISKNISKLKNFEYQVTNIMEINSKKFKSTGFALMDGPFFLFYLWVLKKINKYYIT